LIPPEVTAAQKDLIYTSEKEDIYQYALLLDGEWRSGKSYFVKNSLKNEIEKVERRAIYISLYGISSLGMLQTTVMNAYWADVSPKFEKILEITTALSPVLDIVPYVGSPAKEITRNFFSWKRKNY
jgi:hypothetical protein